MPRAERSYLARRRRAMPTPEALYLEWVRAAGGTRPIRRILVANNGMAASKFMMSVKNWLFLTFGDESLIHLIAMATPEDLSANAKHLHLSDVFYEVCFFLSRMISAYMRGLVGFGGVHAST